MRKLTLLKLCFLASGIVLISACRTNESSLRKELDEIRIEQRQMKDEISEIKTMLLRLSSQQLMPQQQQQAQASVKGIEFDIGDNPVIGSKAAKLIMIEFTDYQCPYCGRYARETFPEIKKQYVDSGKIRYAVADQPLPPHQEASKAAEAAHCAKDQGKFWEMHEALMAKQENLSDLASYAMELNLNAVEFENCLNAGKYKETVNRNMKLANSLGLSSVPVFIIGTVDAKDPRKVTGITTIRGAIPLDNFRQGLDLLLNNQ